jgi:hypothetical protein
VRTLLTISYFDWILLGLIRFALALGFQPEVKDFQPFYTWNPKFKDDLRIGVNMLREAVILDTEKRERAESARKVEKAAADAVKRNVGVHRTCPLYSGLTKLML